MSNKQTKLKSVQNTSPLSTQIAKEITWSEDLNCCCVPSEEIHGWKLKIKVKILVIKL